MRTAFWFLAALVCGVEVARRLLFVVLVSSRLLTLCLPWHADIVTEFALVTSGMEGANSAEFGPDTPYPVIDLMPIVE